MSTRDGQWKAQLYRQARDLLETRAPDVDALAVAEGLEICDSAIVDPGYAAALLCAGPACGGIVLAPGQLRGRRRFSISHEMGHFLIPRHRKDGRNFQCLEIDMRVRDTDARQLEWEANDFAAELLMPSRLFGADAAGRDVGFAAVEQLAGQDMYDVSVTAAAWRLVQTVRDRCALVVCSGGRVQWVARSRSFGLPLIERGQPPEPESLAAAAVRGEGVVSAPQEVPWHAWFGDTRRADGRLYESTHIVRQLNQVASLVWFIEGEGEDDEE